MATVCSVKDCSEQIVEMQMCKGHHTTMLQAEAAYNSLLTSLTITPKKASVKKTKHQECDYCFSKFRVCDGYDAIYCSRECAKLDLGGKWD